MRCTFLALLLLYISISSISSVILDQPVLNKCNGFPEKGSCNKTIIKWAYDQNRQKCVVFVWGGCGGNEFNQFDSEEDCLNSCLQNIQSEFKIYDKIGYFLRNSSS